MTLTRRALALSLTCLATAVVAAPLWAQSVDPALTAAVQGSWRSATDVARDGVRKPVEVLTFMGVKASDTVIEVYPGGGYFTAILGPYLAKSGHLIAAGFNPEPSKAFKERFLDHPETYGKIGYTALSDKSGALAAPNSVDAIVTFRNVHNWMGNGYAEKAMKDFAAALKPGGILGVEEHRAEATGAQDPQAKTGYVQEAFVKKLAADAGLEYMRSSELLANAKDTKDHPFGVWTLPPVLQSTSDGKGKDPNFDQTKYKAIGESDRMLLVFRKPLK